MQKINESNSWLFDKINKIRRLLTQLTERRKDITWISRIKNEQRNITTDTKEIQNTIKGYFKNPYSNLLKDLKEIYEFIDFWPN